MQFQVFVLARQLSRPGRAPGYVRVLLAAMGGGFYIILDKISTIEKSAVPEGTEDVVDNGEPKPIYSLATLIVNLADKDGRRYLRTSMDLELSKAGDDAKIEGKIAQVKDSAIGIMSTRDFDDINSLSRKKSSKLSSRPDESCFQDSSPIQNCMLQTLSTISARRPPTSTTRYLSKSPWPSAMTAGEMIGPVPIARNRAIE